MLESLSKSFVAKDGGSASSAAVGAYSGGFLPSLGSMPAAAGLLVNQATAMAVSAVYACVTIRAQDIARCAPRLFYTKPKSGSREQIFEHDLIELFKRPNAQQTWFEFIEQVTTGYLLRGGGFAALKGHTKRGRVDELIPINPDAVIVLESWNGSVFYNVNRIGLWQMAMLREFPPAIADADMFHLRGLSFNALVGLSNIHMARDAIGIAMGLEQQASRWMANGARPSVMLETDKTLSDAAAKRLQTQYDNLHSGIGNTGRTLILEEGLKAHVVSLSSTDLAFIDQRKFGVEDITRFYRVPPFKLGATELRGIDIEEINNDYVSGTIMPDLHRIEQRFEKTFELGPQSISVSFDERALLRASEKTRYQNYRLALGGAAFAKINEVRRAEQMPGIGPDGDVIYQPSNLAAAGSDRSGMAPDGAGRPAGGNMPAPGVGSGDGAALGGTEEDGPDKAAGAELKFTLPAVDPKSLNGHAPAAH